MKENRFDLLLDSSNGRYSIYIKQNGTPIGVGSIIFLTAKQYEKLVSECQVENIGNGILKITSIEKNER